MSEPFDIDARVIKSYVWHGDQCFFVSTINRRSSAMLGPRRYNETIAWVYDWEKAERGEQVAMGEAGVGSIHTHERICRELFTKGKVEEDES